MNPSLEPDSDAIKMFVGQIPRSMDEDSLRAMFSEYGHIYQLSILRDKQTGQSKGCCFITFFTRKAALDAQNALHNMKTMPGMQHPIQMKPADSEKRNVEERKLFVGMLSKSLTEHDVRSLFANFGAIEECTVLQDFNGQSKGCAFVTFAHRQSAQNAIKALHHSQTMENCRSPMVVKLADTSKEKEAKKMQQNSASGVMNNSNFSQQYLAQLAAASGNMSNLNNRGNMGGVNPQNMMMLQQLMSALGINSNSSQQPYSASGQMSSSNGVSAPGSRMGGGGMQHSSRQGQGLNGNSGMSMNQHQGGDSYSSAMQQFAAYGNAYGGSSSLNAKSPGGSSWPAGKQVEGPEGCNLFIYHLPQEAGDQELLQMFAPFGTVLSAKVFIDKQSNLSKCFGFVSYDNPLSAVTAIQAMNGFQVASKRLKVELKRPKNDGKAY